jgi:ParB family chromosome partitioning protein
MIRAIPSHVRPSNRARSINRNGFLRSGSRLGDGQLSGGIRSRICARDRDGEVMRCLTVQERAEHIAEWVRLTDEKVKAQVAPLDRPHDRGHANQGINAAVRELGIDRTEAQRAVKIASIAPDAKGEAMSAWSGDEDKRRSLGPLLFYPNVPVGVMHTLMGRPSWASGRSRAAT